MKKTIWTEECYRCFSNRRFWGAVIFTVVLYWLIAEVGIPGKGMDGLYYYRLVTGHDMLILSFSFCAWVHGGAYCDEHKHGYDQFILLRVPIRRFVIIRMFTCILSGGAVKILGAWGFLIIMRIKGPWLDSTGISKQEFSGTGWGMSELVSNNHMILYFILDTFLAGCLAGIFAAIAYYFSLYIQEKTIILVFPILLYYFITYYGTSFLGLPDWLQINKIFDISYDVLKNSLYSYIYGIVWFAAITSVICILSYKKYKRIMYG